MIDSTHDVMVFLRGQPVSQCGNEVLNGDKIVL